jgi:hypothetical protein
VEVRRSGGGGGALPPTSWALAVAGIQEEKEKSEKIRDWRLGNDRPHGVTVGGLGVSAPNKGEAGLTGPLGRPMVCPLLLAGRPGS